MTGFLSHLTAQTLGVTPRLQPMIQPLFSKPTVMVAQDSLSTESWPGTVPMQPSATDAGNPTKGENLQINDRLLSHNNSYQKMERDVTTPRFNQIFQKETAGHYEIMSAQKPQFKEAGLKDGSLLLGSNRSVLDASAKKMNQLLISEQNPVMRAASINAATNTLDGEGTQNQFRDFIMHNRDLFPVAPQMQLASSSKPTVQIRIGRVEVRAVMPSKTPEFRRNVSKPSPVLSLSEYLQQQSGGKP